MSPDDPGLPDTPSRAAEPIIDSRDARRVGRLLLVNLACLIFIVVSLAVANIIVVRSHTVWLIAGLLALTASSVYLAYHFLRLGQLRRTALAMLVGTWIAVLGTTVYSPFLLPINALSLVLPLHICYPLLPVRTMRRTVFPLTGLIAVTMTALAVVRHPLQQMPDPPITSIVYLTVVPMMVLLVAHGIVMTHRRSVEQRDLLLESRTRLATAFFEARRRIERDLHDGAQQRLVSATVRLTLARRLLDSSPQKAHRALEDAQAEMNQALVELRELAHGIYPALLTDRGVGKALESVTRSMQIPVEIAVDLPRTLPAEIAASVYFCCLEAVQNASKHSSANRITVAGGVDSGVVHFAVSDDGIGLQQSPEGAGLTNLRDRVSALGGTVEIASRPYAGTRIAGSIPLNPAS